MTEPFNILVSSAGRRVALLEILRQTLVDLGLEGAVIAADASRLSSAFHAADRTFLVPPCRSPEFVPTVLDLCQSMGVRLVVPTIDPELAIYAQHRERFSEVGVTVAVSSPDVVAISEDKELTHTWLTENRFPTVRQAPVAVVTSGTDGWHFPYLVKPRSGSASVGVAVVHDHAELRAAIRGGEFVVQSIAQGLEYSVDLLADRLGRCVCAVPRRRIEVRAGESSKGVTVRSEALEDLGRQLCERLPGAYGPLTAQVFLDPDNGDLAVIELNPRFAGGYPLTWEAGARYPRWLIEEILGLPSTAEPAGWRAGLVMLRYDDAVFVEAGEAGL